jgi:4-diphosphocytidyl-2-C-methyl-D-erythritol kinase
VARALTLRPSAKVNLTLRVGERQASGFHDVRTVLQSIALHDTLTVSARRGPLGLSVRAPGVPSDRTNLVWRAAELLWRDAGRAGDPRDAHLRLEKAIPAAAGLGGGSADAAAALAGLNVIWALGRSRRDLMRLGAALGSDVPFFLAGGTALGAGRGDEVYPLDDITRLSVVVIKPSFGVATADAYGWLDADRAAGTRDARRATRDVDVGWPAGPITLENDLQEPVARRHAGIPDMVEACLAHGALGAAMTGSGSAVFGLFAGTSAARAARRIARPDWLVLVTRTLTRREAGRRIGL